MKRLTRNPITWSFLIAALFTTIIAFGDTTTLTSATPGTTILASTFNKIVSALEVDHVPRNTSSIATAEGGSLGTSTYPWSMVFVGPVSAGVSFDENAGSAIIKVGSVAKLSISSTGLSLDSIADSLITYAKLNSGAKIIEKFSSFTADGSFALPNDVGALTIEGCGGGGGGGGGGGSANPGSGGGGAGGQGAPHGVVVSTVSTGETLTITVGTAGTGGAAGSGGASGSDGVAGGTTTVSGNLSGTIATFRGGGQGLGGGGTAASGAGGAITSQRTAGGAFGGTGGTGAAASNDSSNNALAGWASIAKAGGAAGSGGSGKGAGGGGGGSSMYGTALAGGDGASSAVGGTASEATGQPCVGGGGGAGGSAGNSGGAGSNGIRGSAKIIFHVRQ